MRATASPESPHYCDVGSGGQSEAQQGGCGGLPCIVGMLSRRCVTVAARPWVGAPAHQRGQSVGGLTSAVQGGQSVVLL